MAASSLTRYWSTASPNATPKGPTTSNGTTAASVRVFNAQFEFVDFEVRGAALSRKAVPIPSDLMGFAKDPKVQKLLRSSFQLIEKDAELSGESVTKLRKAIADRYLRVFPNYGTVVLRRDKARFERAVKGLRWYIRGFARRQRRCLQEAIDKNREVVVYILTVRSAELFFACRS